MGHGFWSLKTAAVAAGALSVLMVGVRLGCPPSLDEALVAVPAYNLVHHGFAGTTTWAESGTPWKGMDRRTYNVLPGGILYLSAWFAFLPAAVWVTGMASAGWGLIHLLAFFAFLRRITGDKAWAWLGTLLLALNYYFIIGAASGRVDSMTAALGTAALSSYCKMRLHKLGLAILTSFTLVMCACMTHPQGVLYVLALGTLIIYFDRRSLSMIHLALAVTPFAAGVGLWAVYVSQDPAAALSQLRVNSAGQGRFPRSLNPIWALRREFTGRYMVTNAVAAHTPMMKFVRSLGGISLHLLIFGGVAGALLTPSLRKKSGMRLLLLLAAELFVAMTLLENSKYHFYLVHIEPIYCALAAAFALYSYRMGRPQRFAVVLSIALYLVINIAGVTEHTRSDNIPGYRPAVSFLQRRPDPDALVVGNMNLWFDCGPSHNLKDDSSLGVKSGLVPDYIVVESSYALRITEYKTKDPFLYAAIQTRLESFDTVYDYADYRIYRRR